MKLSVNREIRIAPGSTPIWLTGESSSASIKHLPAIKHKEISIFRMTLPWSRCLKLKHEFRVRLFYLGLNWIVRQLTQFQVSYKPFPCHDDHETGQAPCRTGVKYQFLHVSLEFEFTSYVVQDVTNPIKIAKY